MVSVVFDIFVVLEIRDSVVFGFPLSKKKTDGYVRNISLPQIFSIKLFLNSFSLIRKKSDTVLLGKCSKVPSLF